MNSTKEIMFECKSLLLLCELKQTIKLYELQSQKQENKII